MISLFHVRIPHNDGTFHPVATLAIEKVTQNQIRVAYSVAAKSDGFIKAKGRKIAVERLNSNKYSKILPITDLDNIKDIVTMSGLDKSLTKNYGDSWKSLPVNLSTLEGAKQDLIKT